MVPRWGWRALFLVAALPALLVLPIRFLVRESPDWKRAARVSWGELVRTPGWFKNFGWATAMLAAGFCGYYALTGAYAALLGKELGFALPEVAFHVALFNVGMLLGAVVCGAWAALDPKFTWYVARAAGLTTWLLCAMAIVWGLVLSTKLIRRALPAAFASWPVRLIFPLSSGYATDRSSVRHGSGMAILKRWNGGGTAECGPSKHYRSSRSRSRSLLSCWRA